MKQLSIFTISKSRKPKAKSKVQGAFKTLLLKSSGFWFPPLWLAFDFLEAKSAPKSPTKDTPSTSPAKSTLLNAWFHLQIGLSDLFFLLRVNYIGCL